MRLSYPPNPKAGIWGYDRCTRPDDIKNGLASTMSVAETAFQNGPWTAGGPPTVRGIIVDARPLIGTDGQLGGIHPGGCMYSLPIHPFAL